MIDLKDLSDLEVLILTIIGEARGEPIEGQVAVGCVIRNRVLKNQSSYGEECLKPRQFSCWNENDPNRAFLEELAEKFLINWKLDDPYLIQCHFVALGIFNNDILDNTHNAHNYLSLDLWESPERPSWAKNINFTVSKGNQIFFTA